jgi:hypothetical protein
MTLMDMRPANYRPCNGFRVAAKHIRTVCQLNFCSKYSR